MDVRLALMATIALLLAACGERADIAQARLEFRTALSPLVPSLSPCPILPAPSLEPADAEMSAREDAFLDRVRSSPWNGELEALRKERDEAGSIYLLDCSFAPHSDEWTRRDLMERAEALRKAEAAFRRLEALEGR